DRHLAVGVGSHAHEEQVDPHDEQHAEHAREVVREVAVTEIDTRPRGARRRHAHTVAARPSRAKMHLLREASGCGQRSASTRTAVSRSCDWPTSSEVLKISPRNVTYIEPVSRM